MNIRKVYTDARDGWYNSLEENGHPRVIQLNKKFIADLTQAFMSAGYYYDDAVKAVEWCFARSESTLDTSLHNNNQETICYYALRLIYGLEVME